MITPVKPFELKGDAFSGEIKAGAGSYSTIKPNGRDDVQSEIYKTDQIEGPMETNDWWSSTAWTQYSNAQYPHPLAMINQADGLRIYNPSNLITGQGDYIAGWMNDIDDFVLGHSNVRSFPDTRVDDFSDWFVSNTYQSGTSELNVSYGHGSPYVYATYKGGNPELTFFSTPEIWYGNENSSVLGITTEKGNNYALFGPSGSTWEGLGTKSLTNLLNGKDYLSVAVFPDNSIETLEKFEEYAYSFVVDTKSEYNYVEENSEVVTTFTFETERKEGTNDGTLFALYPHQYKNSNQPLLDYTYESVRGTMKVAEGKSFETNMIFNGVLPSLPDLGNYNKDTLASYIQEDFDLETSAEDTYWYGKYLGQLSTIAPIAQQMGGMDAANIFHDKLKDGVENWFTASDQHGQLKDKSLFYNNENCVTRLGYPDSL